MRITKASGDEDKDGSFDPEAPMTDMPFEAKPVNYELFDGIPRFHAGKDNAGGEIIQVVLTFKNDPYVLAAYSDCQGGWGNCTPHGSGWTQVRGALACKLNRLSQVKPFTTD